MKQLTAIFWVDEKKSAPVSNNLAQGAWMARSCGSWGGSWMTALAIKLSGLVWQHGHFTYTVYLSQEADGSFVENCAVDIEFCHKTGVEK